MAKEERGIQKKGSFHFRKVFDINPVKQAYNFVHENGYGRASNDDKSRNDQDSSPDSSPSRDQQTDSALDNNGDSVSVSVSPPPLIEEAPPPPKRDSSPTDIELMKEKFCKLLLGEDMSGGGKGVSSALALSNAITNLAASVFGEQTRLEPMSEKGKNRWKKEIDWLLSVTDYIVEFVASQQKAKDGATMEIMVTQQRRDLFLNVPALRKLDVMLLEILDNFGDEQEFKYVSKDADESEKGVQRNDKWWLPTIKVPPDGLSEESRQFMQKQKEAVNQVLKASMAINAQILSDMEIPDSYIDSLPKNGRSSLGDLIYKHITVEFFDPLQFLSSMDLSSEHTVLDLKNRIEASIVIWKRKMIHKDVKSPWGSAISLEKRELFEERAETILLLIKQQFPGLPQSSLEISKIQFNRDVGLSILESYSRVLETLANTVMNRLQDVLYADSLTQDPSLAVATWKQAPDAAPLTNFQPGDETEKLSNAADTPSSMTLSDFMGWNFEAPDTEIRKNKSAGNLGAYNFEEEEEEEPITSKSGNIKKFSYLDKIDIGGQRSPTARH